MYLGSEIKSVAALGITAALAIFSSQSSAAPVGNPNAGNNWSTTSAVSIVRHSGERDTGSGGSGREIINMINGSGISGTSGELHGRGTEQSPNVFIPHGQMAMFYNGNALPSGSSAPNPGTSQSAGSHWVEFDLGSVVPLTDIAIWNYNEPTWYTMGWKTIKIQVAQTDSTNPADWTTVYEGTLPLSPGAGAVPTTTAIVLPVSSVSARFVSLTNTGLGGEATWLEADDGSHAGLSEIRFNSGLPIPEPASLSLLGLSALALVRKRRV